MAATMEGGRIRACCTATRGAQISVRRPRAGCQRGSPLAGDDCCRQPQTSPLVRTRGAAGALPPGPRRVNPIFAAALEVQGFCADRELAFCFIGGLALQRWGEPRLTQDVDLTVISGFGREGEYID